MPSLLVRITKWAFSTMVFTFGIAVNNIPTSNLRHILLMFFVNAPGTVRDYQTNSLNIKVQVHAPIE